MRRKPRDIAKIFSEGTEIDAALRRGVQNALRMHKSEGNPIVAWRNGQVVWIPPEEIPVDEVEEPKPLTPARRKRRKRRS